MTTAVEKAPKRELAVNENHLSRFLDSRSSNTKIGLLNWTFINFPIENN